MEYVELNYNQINHQDEGVFLKFLYSTIFGRCILKILVCPFVSKFVGIVLNTPMSKPLIKRYVKKYDINLGDKKFKSFNDFFKRENKIEKKSKKSKEFISTAESRITCYDISEDLIIDVKKSKYSVEELIQDKELAQKYLGGLCIIYRLIPSDYHRYIFIDSGKQDKLKYIKGKLHTVSPISHDKYKVFSENSREISLLKTYNFGDILQIEVGALCVGKIKNHSINKFKKYDEKGYFEFGGSTIIQLIEKDKVILNEQIKKNTANNIETKISIGDVIGRSNTSDISSIKYKKSLKI
ncbi:MAG: phosphatidylserine decarboxylase [Clostridia bacterium]|nr:phosphatidylserine decarboxylase [Clostridia bacterium]